MLQMNRTLKVLLVSVIAGLCCGAVKLVDDSAPVKPPKPGGIVGKVTSRTDIVSLHAVSRVTKKKYQPYSFSQKTGSFTFAKLPGAATYDLCLRLDDGREIEGIDLSFVDVRLLKLARRISSHISIKLAAKEHQDIFETFMIFDNSAYILLTHPERYDALGNFYGPLKTGHLSEQFEELWQRATVDSSLRRLSL